MAARPVPALQGPCCCRATPRLHGVLVDRSAGADRPARREARTPVERPHQRRIPESGPNAMSPTPTRAFSPSPRPRGGHASCWLHRCPFRISGARRRSRRRPICNESFVAARSVPSQPRRRPVSLRRHSGTVTLGPAPGGPRRPALPVEALPPGPSHRWVPISKLEQQDGRLPGAGVVAVTRPRQPRSPRSLLLGSRPRDTRSQPPAPRCEPGRKPTWA